MWRVELFVLFITWSFTCGVNSLDYNNISSSKADSPLGQLLLNETLNVCALETNSVTSQYFECPAGFKCVGKYGISTLFPQIANQTSELVDQLGVCIQCAPGEDCPKGRIAAFGVACALKSPYANCSAGSACVSFELLSVSTGTTVGPVDAFDFNGNPVYLDGLCLPCQMGQFCPEGTVDAYFVAQPILCPAGSYCPNPTSSILCEPGTFCQPGQFFEINCTQRGSYCPENSTLPQPCPKGFYCPSPAEKIVCPKGKFCKEFSAGPHDCWFLFVCHEGSVGPNASIPTIASLLLVSSALVACFLLVRKSVSDADKLASQKLQTLVKDINNVNAIIRNILGTKSNSVKFRGFQDRSNKVTLGFSDLSLTINGDRLVLDGVSGEFYHSRITAIMGPSGSGKSNGIYFTLLILTFVSRYIFECIDRKSKCLRGSFRASFHQQDT